MRLSASARTVVSVLVVGSGSLAVAQSNEPAQGSTTSDATSDGTADVASDVASDGAGTETGDEIAVELFIPTAQKSLDEMRRAVEQAAAALKDARDKKDAVQMACISEQLDVMTGILSVAEAAHVEMQDAVGASDTQRARYEFRKIVASRNRMQELLQAALTCAGAEASASNTSVEMAIDESLALTDPYYGNMDFFFDTTETLKEGTTAALGDDDPMPDLRPPPASEVLN